MGRAGGEQRLGGGSPGFIASCGVSHPTASRGRKLAQHMERPRPPRCLIDRVSLEMGLGHAGFSSTERKWKNIYFAPPQACLREGRRRQSERGAAGGQALVPVWGHWGGTGTFRAPTVPPGLMVQAEQGGDLQGRGLA